MLVLLATLGAGLSSCAATPEPNWQVLQKDASSFIEAATAKGDSLGAGSMRVSAQDSPPEDDEGITLTFQSAKRIDVISVACFGQGTIRFGYPTRSGSSWIARQSVDVRCDGSEKTIPLDVRGDAVRFNAALVDGPGSVLAAVAAGGAE